MSRTYYLGIDIGGTKIAGALAGESGGIVAREKIPTPRPSHPRAIKAALRALVKKLDIFFGTPSSPIRAVAIGIPGIIHPRTGVVLATPNMDIAGWTILKDLSSLFKVPVLIDNDVNLGLRGETWRGAAAGATLALGIFQGTGIGGACFFRGKILRGVSGAAGEFGHTILNPKGPRCTCGNKGCLEAFASRWAIERDIRAGIARGEQSTLSGKLRSRKKPIKSKMLKAALDKKDPLVRKVLQNASRSLGHACVSLVHIFNPDIIVMGGGVIEACHSFMIPVIRRTLTKDALFSGIPPCKIRTAELGDDAVIMGALVMARETLESQGRRTLVRADEKGFSVCHTRYMPPFLIRADGKVRELKKMTGVRRTRLNAKTLKSLCKKKPELVIVSYGRKNPPAVDNAGRAYLNTKKIDMAILPRREALRTYAIAQKKAALIVLP